MFDQCGRTETEPSREINKFYKLAIFYDVSNDSLQLRTQKDDSLEYVGWWRSICFQFTKEPPFLELHWVQLFQRFGFW